MRTIASWVVLCSLPICAGVASPARGVSISLAAPASIEVGEPLVVDVFVSGLVDGTEALRAFDLDLGFDAAILDLGSVSFDVFLGTPGLMPGPGVQALVSSGEPQPGVVDAAATSLLSSASLHALQPASFRLLSVAFTAIAPGDVDLSFLEVILADTAGATFPVASATGITVQVVPEPATAALVAASLLALAAARRSWMTGGARIAH